jgi:hypothetical protein
LLFNRKISSSFAVATSAISIHPKAFCEHLKVVAENRFIYTNLTQQQQQLSMAMGLLARA